MTKPYYQDDYVTLYHGKAEECLEWLTADVLITDPPYGMLWRSGRVPGRAVAIIAGDDSVEIRDAALEAWGSKPALVFGTWRTPRPADTKNVLIWDKGTDLGTGDLNIPWGFSHEEIYVLGKWPKLAPGGRVREGGTPSRVPSIIHAGKPNNAAERPNHPTPKPVGLMERLIEKSPKGTIADPFAGSGSTLVAAKNRGRKAIGVELEERYCEIITKRLSQELLELEWTA